MIMKGLQDRVGVSSAKFPVARAKLGYPLYACDFDPQDASRLVVGGGGGAGRSGVGNKISILTSTTAEDVQLAGEIDLSRDEDSVMCLAVGQRKGRGTLVYAGVNSSAADQASGKNEHFRIFALEPTKRAAAGASASGCRVAELARTAMFQQLEPPDKYQRIVRLAPSWAGTQVGAVASNFGSVFEVVLFEVSNQGSPVPRSKGSLILDREPNDLDVVATAEEAYRLAYCDNYDIYALDVTRGGAAQPRSVFTLPVDEPGGRPQFRFLRFLTPEFVMTATNLPKRSGVLLQVYRLPAPVQGKGKGAERDEREMKARLALSVKVPRKTAATAFAVQNLSPPAHPSAKLDRAQFVVAVACHDSTITVYTLEHKRSGEISLVHDLLPLRTITDIHALQISGLALSHFAPPVKATSRHQFVKLASISLDNTVVLHSIPLRKLIDRHSGSGSSSTPRRGPPRPVRYVVAARPQRPQDRFLVVALAAIVLLLAVAGQAILEVYGAAPSVLGARHVLGSADPASFPLGPRVKGSARNDFINSILGGVDIADALPRDSGRRIVLRDAPVLDPDGADQAAASQFEVQLQEENGQGAAAGPAARSWEDLTARQKALWKERLQEAGHWGDGMGETVFKGMLFGEIAGAVGRVVGG